MTSRNLDLSKPVITYHKCNPRLINFVYIYRKIHENTNKAGLIGF